MPKQIVSDVFGELLETGKSTAKAGKKAAGDITKQTVKTLAGVKSSSQKSSGVQKPPPRQGVGTPKSDASGLDWLEKMAPKQAKPQPKQDDDEQKRVEQIKKLSQMDDKRSIAA